MNTWMFMDQHPIFTLILFGFIGFIITFTVQMVCDTLKTFCLCFHKCCTCETGGLKKGKFHDN